MSGMSIDFEVKSDTNNWTNVDTGLINLQLKDIFQVKAEKEGAESLPAEYLASPLSKQPQEPQPKQVGNDINDYSHFRLDI